MRRWAIINALLGVLVLLLALQIVRTWARALPPIEPPRGGPVATGAGPSEGGKSKRGADKSGARAHDSAPVLVAAIVEKDLFDPSRRPPTAEEVKTEVPRETGPPQGVTVVGIRIFGRDREAFVTDQSQGGQQRRLRVGDQVANFTVKAIEPSVVVLASPSGDPVRLALALDKAKAGARPGGAARAPAGASPAAGATGAPTAAGVTPKPAVPSPTAGAAAAKNPQLQQLPAEVRQKLEQLKEKERTPGARGGRNPR
jgi:hypothetical protein